MQEVSVLNEAILKLEVTIKNKNEFISIQQSTIKEIYVSNSWKVTAPVRKFSLALRRIPALLKFFGNSALPVGSKRRNFIKKVLLWKKGQGGRLIFKKNAALKTVLQNKINSCECEPDIIDDKYTVSVIIPTFNGSSDLIVLLPNLIKQIGLKNLEIIIVDSQSTDSTLDICKKFGVKIIEIQQSQFTHSFSRNLGAESASNDYFLFMVQDALPSSNKWVYEMLNRLEEYNVAALSCGEFCRMDADLFCRMQQWYHNSFMGLSDEVDKILSYPEKNDYNSLRKNSQLNNVACVMKKSIFKKYKFKNNYAEDLDLGMRLILDRHAIAIINSTKVIHSHNRPAYYILKRSFVDCRQLCILFPDYCNLEISKDELCNNALLIYQLLFDLCKQLSDCSGVSSNIETVRKQVIEIFKLSLRKNHNLKSDLEVNPYVDREFFM